MKNPLTRRRSGVGLPLALAVCLSGSCSSAAEPSGPEPADVRFPVTDAVLDVTRPPYGAKGDGASDDTAALQKALDDAMGRHKVLYLPKGTYLISATLNWTNKRSDKQTAYGFTWVQGQSARETVIRLKDDTFTDRAAPKALMWCGGFGSADWFHNYVQDVTFDVGRGNAGAIGLQFYSNNTGAVRNVAIRSPDGRGVTGLDLAHRDMNGPLLVKGVSVRGFEIGIRTAGAVNGQTFEHVALAGQTEFGLDNHGQALAVRGLTYEGAAVAVRSYGTLALLDAKLTGRGAANRLPAVVNYNGGRLCLRDVATAGYGRAVADVTTPDYAAALRVAGADKPGSEGPKVAEYFSHAPTRPFGGTSGSLRLTVRETPDVPHDDPKTWAVVDAFGADPTGSKDSAGAVQKAIDSGATTVFFPGSYALDTPVTVRGKVRRLLGAGGWIDYLGKSKPDFVVAAGDAPAVVVEHFSPINGGVAIDSERTVVLRSLEAHRITRKGKGELYLEDVATGDLRLARNQQVWARQLNVENEGAHVTNDGGSLWVLGYKTERGGTLLRTAGGGASEVFGTFSYTTTAGKLAPMFVTEDARAFAFFGEVCYTGDPFAVLIRETRRGVSREVKRGGGSSLPYISGAADR